ncbi:hypothetical protein H4R34_001843 [Dimargaris verticillata]|uniref:Uncharacterized protein n=1 Tax=Dimargaris verticillata TaxID=2761393 RepID=A0A9W8EE44_9FUNG|nr:hypothetical protein H4R34_001843 [Dimargaris verticillata]
MKALNACIWLWGLVASVGLFQATGIPAGQGLRRKKAMSNLKAAQPLPLSRPDRTVYSQRLQQLVHAGTLLPEAYSVLQFRQCHEQFMCLVVKLIDNLLESEKVMGYEQFDDLYQLVGSALLALLAVSRSEDFQEILRPYLQRGGAAGQGPEAQHDFVAYQAVLDEHLRSHFVLMYMIRVGMGELALAILDGMHQAICQGAKNVDALSSPGFSPRLTGPASAIKSGYETLQLDVIKVALVHQEEVENSLSNQHWFRMDKDELREGVDALLRQDLEAVLLEQAQANGGLIAGVLHHILQLDDSLARRSYDMVTMWSMGLNLEISLYMYTLAGAERPLQELRNVGECAWKLDLGDYYALNVVTDRIALAACDLQSKTTGINTDDCYATWQQLGYQRKEVSYDSCCQRYYFDSGLHADTDTDANDLFLVWLPNPQILAINPW